MRRFARKRSRFDGCVTFPSTADGDARAKLPDPEPRGPLDGTTRLRDAAAGGCCFGGFVAARPARARPRAVVEVPDAMVTSSWGVVRGEVRGLLL